MGEDLWRFHVLCRRDVTRLLKERKVDHGCGIAHRPGVAVPVPGAADVATSLDDRHVVDPRLLEAGTSHEPGEPSPNDGHGDVLVDGVTRLDLHVGVIEEVCESPRWFEVLLIAFGAKPLVALKAVAPRKLVVIDRRRQTNCGAGGHLLSLPTGGT